MDMNMKKNTIFARMFLWSACAFVAAVSVPVCAAPVWSSVALYSRTLMRAVDQACTSLMPTAIKGGLALCVLHLMNEHRNICRSARISTSATGGIVIQTDGFVDVRGHDEDYVRIATRRHDYNSDLLYHGNGNRVRRLLCLLLGPSHKRVTHHTVYVPRARDVTVYSHNAQPFACVNRTLIDICGVDGTITARAEGGDVSIRSPGGNVIIEDAQGVEVTNFAQSLRIDRCRKRGQITRAPGNVSASCEYRGALVSPETLCTDDGSTQSRRSSSKRHHGHPPVRS